MEIQQLTDELIDYIGDLKGRLVEYALSADVRRHLRGFLAEHRSALESGKFTPELLIDSFVFEYKFDDGSIIIDRFLARKNPDQADAKYLTEMKDSFSSIFEVEAESSPLGSGSKFDCLILRCCHSDLEYQVVPTIPGTLNAMEKGMFLIGRISPIADSGFWSPSGPSNILPASVRSDLAKTVQQNVLEQPKLSHRNPEYLKRAKEQVRQTHERFVTEYGSNVVFGSGQEVAQKFSDISVGIATTKKEVKVRENAREILLGTVADGPFINEPDVALYSHPLSGLSFFVFGGSVAAALAAGAEASDEGIELIRSYLDDASLNTQFIEQLIVERLPASQEALARALGSPEFNWSTEGQKLIDELPGESEPVLGNAIVPMICKPDLEHEDL